MGWMKFDDRFLDHPKVVRLERLAPSRGVHLFMGLVSYCKQHITDGRVPADMVRVINGPAQRWRQQALGALIEVGLVERAGDDLLIHDWLDWNPSRSKIVGAPKPPQPANDAPRQRGDAQVIAGRQRVDADLTTDRQHIKRGDTDQLSDAPSRARSRIPIPIPIPILDPPVTPPPSSVRLAPAVAAEPTSTSSAAKAKRGKPSKARSQPCPPDLKPDATTAAKAWELGFSDAMRDAEIARCVDWAHSKAVCRSDWQATLRNWFRKTAEDRGLQPRKPRDAQWAAYQQKLRDANQPVKTPAKPPAGFDQNVRSLFG